MLDRASCFGHSGGDAHSGQDPPLQNDVRDDEQYGQQIVHGSSKMWECTRVTVSIRGRRNCDDMCLNGEKCDLVRTGAWIRPEVAPLSTTPGWMNLEPCISPNGRISTSGYLWTTRVYRLFRETHRMAMRTSDG